ncbi:uncharacterized protein LOC132729148 [Ruditapes philippinarum]|uniref:uncharacterized protein LOC132729148 n=1 Tax=Ruditapes philippinarum TaxID=129788 RepID=UPI00295B7F8A|nr:uncharacterized protein LOC132729148 [Ruditapes philippinarum]
MHEGPSCIQQNSTPRRAGRAVDDCGSAQPQQSQEHVQDNPRVDARQSRGQKRQADELDDMVDVRLLETEADVWVLGDSIPFWAGQRAKNTGKPNLRLKDLTIAWWGVRGLRWQSFRHSIESQVLFSSPPSIIIVHLGGNDLADLPILNLKDVIRDEIFYLREAFPTTVLIWVDILQRQTWHNATGGWVAMENKRKRVNRIGRQLVHSSGKSDTIKPDIDAKTAFFRADGVHLNDIGLEFLLDYFKDSIIKNVPVSQ